MDEYLDRDERTAAVENASFRWGYHVVSFGLLLLVGYRSIAHDESPWDLLGLVVLGGVVAAGYQWSHKVLTTRRLLKGLGAMLVAIVVAAMATWIG